VCAGVRARELPEEKVHKGPTGVLGFSAAILPLSFGHLDLGHLILIGTWDLVIGISSHTLDAYQT
jgi:hypothetical protein